jgi:hypothetical protein
MEKSTRIRVLFFIMEKLLTITAATAEAGPVEVGRSRSRSESAKRAIVSFAAS